VFKKIISKSVGDSWRIQGVRGRANGKKNYAEITVREKNNSGNFRVLIYRLSLNSVPRFDTPVIIMFDLLDFADQVGNFYQFFGGTAAG